MFFHLKKTIFNIILRTYKIVELLYLETHTRTHTYTQTHTHTHRYLNIMKGLALIIGHTHHCTQYSVLLRSLKYKQCQKKLKAKTGNHNFCFS